MFDFEEEICDAVRSLSRNVFHAANAITPSGNSTANDAAGGVVGSLTEAVMGVTAGLCRIAESIDELAKAVAERDAE